MKQVIILVGVLALMVSCKKTISIENESRLTDLLSGTAPNPYPVEPDPYPPCPNTYEPWNNSFFGPLIEVQDHKGIECAFMLSSYCAAGDVDNWRFNDPLYLDGINVIMIKVGNSLPKPVYRVTITSLIDNSILSDGIVNMGTGLYTSWVIGEFKKSELCISGDASCFGAFECVTGPYFYSRTYSLDDVSVRITNMNNQSAFCYEVYTQYVGP